MLIKNKSNWDICISHKHCVHVYLRIGFNFNVFILRINAAFVWLIWEEVVCVVL